MPKEGNGKKPVVDGDPEKKQTLDALVEERTEDLLRVTESLVREVNERERIGEALEEQLRFERLLSDVSARFVNIAPEGLDGEIENALERVLDFFQVDRCALIQSMPGKTSWRITHAVSSAQIPTVPVGVELSRSLNPWTYQTLLAGYVVRFSNPDETPPEAEADRKTWREWGIRSNLNIPILTGDSVDHVIAINAVVRERAWPEKFIPRLRLLGEIFVNALERRNVEHALRESEERLSLATASAETGIWIMNTGTGSVWVTDKLRDLFRFAPHEELSFERFAEIIHPDDRGRVKEAVRKSMTEREPLHIEYRIVHPDGAIRWLVSRGRSYTGSAGQPKRLMGVSNDVTDRKRIGEALEERLRFERLLSDISARFVNVAPDQLDGEIENALRMVLQFFQVDRCGLLRALPEKNTFQVTHVAYGQNIPPVPAGIELPISMYPWAYEKLILKREVVAYSRPDELPPEAIVDKQTWAEWGIRSNVVIPILIGEPAVHIISINSVNSECAWPEEFISRLRLLGEIVVSAIERSKMEQALRESEERLKLAADSAEARLWELDLDSGIIWVTEKGRLFYGLTPGDEMTLERLVSHVHPEDRRLIREGIETARSGKDLSVEYRVEVRPGTLRWVNSLGRLSVDPAGKRYRIMGVSIDVTDRKVTELHLGESRTLLAALVDSTSDLIWSVDAERFGLLTFNRGLSDYFLTQRGIRIEVGMRPEDLFPPGEFVQTWRTFYLRALKEGSYSTEYRVYAGTRTLLLNLNRLERGGDVFGVSVFGKDITERKAMEARLLEQLGEIEQLQRQLEKENVYLREELGQEQGFGKIIGKSDALNYVLFRVGQVAPTDATVLILGETGTGKGMVANAIHGMSARKDRPMITVNCAALPANLIESELFGREKGAFTGAHARQAGRFEVADGGTIFLDEIGELPLELQAKLLRVLQEGEFERLGSAKTVRVDVRVIASTSRDLRVEARAGRFREDLYYRLNVFPVSIPPLRKRADDIPELVRFFVDKYARKVGRQIESIPKTAMKALEGYDWPGNVRELEHVIERAVITTEGRVLRLADRLEPLLAASDAEVPLRDLAAMEREHIERVLKETRWRIEGPKGAAAILHLHPSTLRFRIKKLGLRRP